MRSLLLFALAAMVAAPMLTGCAALSVKGKAGDLPAMNVPPPPPRVIEPAPEPLPEPVSELPAVPASPSAPRNGTRPPAARQTAPDPKPVDPKPVEPPPPDPAPVAMPPAAPAAQLRTPQTADTSNAEKGVRSTLDRAKGLLNNVDYRQLTVDRKKAYDDALRFIRTAEDKIKAGDFVFAQAVAEKAEMLAKELAGK
jgi:outer membrane biosynthesis protein TonB